MKFKVAVSLIDSGPPKWVSPAIASNSRAVVIIASLPAPTGIRMRIYRCVPLLVGPMTKRPAAVPMTVRAVPNAAARFGRRDTSHTKSTSLPTRPGQYVRALNLSAADLVAN
jgi:hypothetical protein